MEPRDLQRPPRLPVRRQHGARLYKKSEGDKSRTTYLSHVLTANRNGLVVGAETTLATGTGERDAALTMAKRSMTKAGSTLGADKGCDGAGFVK